MAVKAADGQRLFDCVQATWNLMEQSAGNCWCAGPAASLTLPEGPTNDTKAQVAINRLV